MYYNTITKIIILEKNLENYLILNKIHLGNILQLLLYKIII